jgi:hypothetical protein
MTNNKEHVVLSISAPKAIRGMLQQEIKDRARGAQSHLFCKAFAKMFGPKYPKLLSEFNKLHGYED